MPMLARPRSMPMCPRNGLGLPLVTLNCRRLNHPEALSVISRLKSDHLLKHFAERTCILVADVPGHLVNRATGQFQHLARLADAQTLTIFRRVELRRLAESPQECALLKAGICRHVRKRDVTHTLLLQPVLDP